MMLPRREVDRRWVGGANTASSEVIGVSAEGEFAPPRAMLRWRG